MTFLPLVLVYLVYSEYADQHVNRNIPLHENTLLGTLSCCMHVNILSVLLCDAWLDSRKNHTTSQTTTEYRVNKRNLELDWIYYSNFSPFLCLFLGINLLSWIMNVYFSLTCFAFDLFYINVQCKQCTDCQIKCYNQMLQADGVGFGGKKRTQKQHRQRFLMPFGNQF